MARSLRQVCCRLALLNATVAGWGCTATVSAPSAEQPAATESPDGSGGSATPERSTPDGIGWATRFPKLSNEQWENTVADLFHGAVPAGLSESFVAEPADGGYTNEAAATITVASDIWTRYQVAAEAVAELVVGDAEKLDELVPPGTPSTLPERARATIETPGRRAYRRPLTAVEINGYVALFDTGAALEPGDAFGSGMRQVIQALLQSPHFLYRVEGWISRRQPFCPA
jgi:hypothetical protein